MVILWKVQIRTVSFCQSILVIVVFVCIVPFMGCNIQPSEKKRINVVFRFDDYSARSSMDIELRIIDVFRKNKASVTFGVIPFVCAGNVNDPSPQGFVPLTPIKRDILKTAFKDGIVDIALHGYSHQTINADQMTEFSGLDYNSQVERLAKGKKLLESIIDAPVTIFVPPWNKYDQNTLRALKELGFSTLSADRNGKAPKGSMLNFLPETCDLPLLRDAVKAARSSSDNQPVIVVVLHSYDFREINEKHGKIDYQEFSDLLNWLKSEGDVRLLSIGQSTKVINELGADRFLLNKRFGSLLDLLPSLLRGEYGNLYLESKLSLIKTWCLIGVFYLTIGIFGAFASFMVGSLVFPRSVFVMYLVTSGSIVLSVIISIYDFYKLQVGFNSMTVTAGVVGASVGVCICFIHLKKIRLLKKTCIGKAKA